MSIMTQRRDSYSFEMKSLDTENLKGYFLLLYPKARQEVLGFGTGMHSTSTLVLNLL